MAHQFDIAALLGHLPLFSSLTGGQLEQLARASQQIRVARQQFIFHRGDAASGLYVLALGSVVLSIPSPAGQEKIIEFFKPGQAFGEALMFLDQPYTVQARTLEDSLVIWIDKQHLYAVIDGNPSFARRLLNDLSQRMHNLLQDIETINLQDATQRVIGFLLQQPRRGSELSFPFSKHVIASKLGLAPETLSRLLHQLCSAGLITVSGRTVVILNKDGLQHRLQGSS